MASTAVVTEDTATIVAEEEHRLRWGVVIAGAFTAIATTFFLLTLGAGVGLALTPVGHATTSLAFFNLGAIYFVAAQAFGFALGGYIVGRLIGPEAENTEEEEFRAGANGFVMWALGVVGGLLLIAAASGVGGSPLASAIAPRPANQAADTAYWVDKMFGPARNPAEAAADKAQARRILARNAPAAVSQDDNDRLTRLVAESDGISTEAARARVNDAEKAYANATHEARRIASITALWTAFALLFGVFVAVAASIAARWQDDRITFSLSPRR